MATLKFDHNDESIELPDDSPIAEVCEEAGVPFACTEGVCGTCVVEVLDGKDNLSTPTEEEVDFFGDDCLDERLACQCKIKKGTVTVSF